ncbi:MAG: hypothetical protein Q7U04_04690, partial [Bacteriovorax sp.]|nr:hypothetical protein [Bacteriovorax sp.]
MNTEKNQLSESHSHSGKKHFNLLQNILKPSTKEVRAHKLKQNYPWPSPSPYDHRLPLTVIHVPDEEVKDFIKKIVSRYIKSV